MELAVGPQEATAATLGVKVSETNASVVPTGMAPEFNHAPFLSISALKNGELLVYIWCISKSAFLSIVVALRNNGGAGRTHGWHAETLDRG